MIQEGNEQKKDAHLCSEHHDLEKLFYLLTYSLYSFLQPDPN